MMASPVEEHSLHDFAGEVSFRDSDKSRFHQFYPQDSLTTVALCKLNLKLIKDKTTVSEDCLFMFITRSKRVVHAGKVNKIHAEKSLVEETKKKIADFEKKHETKLHSIQLVVMITYSPCKECRPLLRDFLEKLNGQIEFVLRFAYLYKDRERGNEIPIKNLANWLIELDGLNGGGEAKKVVRLEAISVRNELSDYSHRDKVKWIEVKEKREREDNEVIDIVQQVYTTKRKIEDENQQRADELAAEVQQLEV